MKLLLASILLFSAVGAAQTRQHTFLRPVAEVPAPDLNGTWKATAEGPQGSMERTFVFKVDGAKLTGETTSTMLGKSTIADGKVDGDTFSFTITADMQGTQLKLIYKGKITGDQIKVTSQVDGDGGGQSFEWTGKRVQP
jgi:hypothetical protein